MGERAWSIVLEAGDSAIYVVERLTDVVAEVFQWASSALFRLRWKWKRAIRPKAGLTPDGLTREQVARREAARAKTLRKMGRPDLIGDSYDAS